MDIDSDMNVHIHQPEASPLIFIPEVDFESLPDPSIINAF
jgi:hypothetical protein